MSWVVEFAGRKRACFLGSMVLAMLGVAASFIPYMIIASIVRQLLSGVTDLEIGVMYPHNSHEKLLIAFREK